MGPNFNPVAPALQSRNSALVRSPVSLNRITKITEFSKACKRVSALVLSETELTSFLKIRMIFDAKKCVVHVTSFLRVCAD